MKKRILSILLAGIVGCCYAQFTNTDDFININTTRFFNDAGGPITIPAAFNTNTNSQNEYRYLVSTMRLANEIRRIFALGPTGSTANTNNPDDLPLNVAFNNFRIIKTAVNLGYLAGYTDQRATTSQPNLNANANINKPHAVFVGPLNNIAGGRPTILLTNGSGENLLNNWSATNFFAADLAMRGYNVLIYENFFCGKRNTPRFDSIFTTIYYPNYLLLAILGKSKQVDAYGMVQAGVAAMQMTIANSVALNVDVNRIYAMGGSWGATSSLLLGYADDDPAFGAVNFRDNTFASTFSVHDLFGSFTAKSRAPDLANYKNRIRAVVGLGTNLPQMPYQYVGNIYDPQDAPVPTLFMHALNDNATNIINNPALGYGPGSAVLTNNYVANNIRFHVYVNCGTYNEHPFASGYGNSDNSIYINNVSGVSNLVIANAYNNPSSNLNAYYQMKHFTYLGTQVLDINRIAGNFLTRSTSTNPISSNVRFYVQPSMTRNSTASPVAGYNFGDFFPSIPSTKYPNGRLINTPVQPENPVGCINIPNTTYGGGFFSPNAGRYTQPENSFEKTNNSPLLYPNPTKGQFNISTGISTTIQEYRVEIYYTDGRIAFEGLFKETIEAGSTLHRLIDISSQPNGVYFIRITSGNSILLNKAVMLHH